jgi:NMD protein affecting ribosome stability and mRNA decay
METNKQDFEVIARKRDFKETRVTKLFPSIEVLHPETYASAKVENKADVKLGEKVKVFQYKKGLFIIG